MSSIPNPGVYGEMELQALQAWQRAKSALRERQGQIWQQYGFKGKFDDATGAVSGVELDVNNPYGEYQQMLGNQGRDLDSATEEAESRGLGGGGLGAQGVTRARGGHGMEQVNFGRRFSSDNADVQSGWQNAGFSYQQALLAAQRAAIQDAINNQQFNVQGPQPRATIQPGGNAVTKGLAALHQQNLAAVKKLTPGTGNINEAVRLAAAMPKPKPVQAKKPPVNYNLRVR
jgi:hypothetical protein